MTTKKLREENDRLREEVEELKSQLHKIKEDLTSTTTAVLKSNTTGEAKQVMNTAKQTISEEQTDTVTFMSKQYDDLEAFHKKATKDIQQITKKLDFISERCDEIMKSLDAAEQYSYQYNIKIMGVPQFNEKESAETTANLCVKLFME